jgi:pimeloyl-ACP methyl ester carboxylesterase
MFFNNFSFYDKKKIFPAQRNSVRKRTQTIAPPMFPSFLPPAVENLTETASIETAQKIQRTPIKTPYPFAKRLVKEKATIPTTYICQGSGSPPILLLHGFDSSVLEFRRLLPLLTPHRETWAIDLLGFGFTERLADLSFDSEAIKTHLYATWQQLINRPVILVGASMGGAAAIDFTLTYPDAVEKLVLLDSVGCKRGPIVGKFLFPPLDFWAAEFLRRPGVRDRISYNAYYNKSLNSADAWQCAALHLEMPNWHRALISFTKSGGYGSFQKHLQNLQPPTLILWGDSDRILGTQDAYKFQQGIPHSQLTWIPNCGHVPHLEQPELVSQQIASFLPHATNSV